ncbi:MAG: hypothetical protein ACOYMN_00815, partial [Roseimicrobium sp.]
HQTLTGEEIYRSMGQQDLTADVNFTDLASQGATLGWEVEPLLTQRDFLRRYLPRFSHRLTNDASLAFLADEAGAGAAFKVLMHRCSSGRN